MARGRRRIAPEIHEASGAYRKNPKRRNKDAPKANGDRPKMPSYFSEHERSKWEEICETLESNGIMSTDCLEILIAYCTAYGGWMKAREAVQRTGIVLVQKIDGVTEVKRNPFSVELHKYRDEMNRLLPELGLTPASRSKLKVVDDDKDESAFSALLSRMSGKN